MNPDAHPAGGLTDDLPYILPDSSRPELLEFDWDPYEHVWFFKSQRSFDQASGWFSANLPDGQNTNPDDGKLEYYFSDVNRTEWSILVADTLNRSSVNDLTAYVGSSRLTKMAEAAGKGVIVVVFKHRKKAKR